MTGILDQRRAELEQMRRINSEVRRQRRAMLRNQFGGRCAYCNTPTGRNGTVDHYVAQAHGGTNTWPNLRWACRHCNERKADMLPHEWQAWLAAHRPAKTETRYEMKVRLLTAAIRRSIDGGAQEG